MLIIISLFFLFIGYKGASEFSVNTTGSLLSITRISKTTDNNRHDSILEINEKLRIRKASKIAFYFCYVCSLIGIAIKILTSKSIGYVSMYISSNVIEAGLLDYFSSFTIIAISIFLATCPPKKSSLKALICYELYGILTMMTGHRFSFIAISMYFLVYVVYRNKIESGWISRKFIVLICAALPFIILLMNTINYIRMGQINFLNESFLEAIVNFLDQQGGSVNVIKRIFYYKAEISDMFLTSFSNIRMVVFQNAIMRHVFDIQVYSGNSVDNAFYGHFLSHRLSYYEYGDFYLAGHGVGSCYIAELFHDFGFLGVIIGNLIYGVVLKRISDIGTNHYFRKGLLFASQFYLFLAPRGDFDGMVSGLFSVVSVLGMLGIFVLSSCIKVESNKC